MRTDQAHSSIRLLQRVLVGGNRLAVAYDGPEHADTGKVIEHVVSSLAQDTGVERRLGEPSCLLGTMRRL